MTDTPTQTPDAAPGAYVLPPHAGASYLEVLGAFHEHLRPRRYLEIGTSKGHSLALARCASLAIDPAFQLTEEVVGSKPVCLLHQATSDAFFAAHDPVDLLGGPIDLAFLDGLHLFEFLLRDFINTERACSPDSVIAIDDCLPTDGHVARRESGDMSLAHITPDPIWWAGDVWKVVRILQRWRPELTIRAVNCPPTGMIVVTGLNPSSTLLSDAYEQAVAEHASATLTQGEAEAYFASLSWLPTSALAGPEAVRAALPQAAAWRT